MSYEEFKAAYQIAFNQMSKYTPNEIGSVYYANEMAKLSEDYPEFEERLEKELGV